MIRRTSSISARVQPYPRTWPSPPNADNAGSLNYGPQRLLAFGSRREVVVVDPLRKIFVQCLTGAHHADICCVRWGPTRLPAPGGNKPHPITCLLASGDSSGCIVVWDAASAQVLARFDRAVGAVVDMAWYPDPERQTLVAVRHPSHLMVHVISQSSNSGAGSMLWERNFDNPLGLRSLSLDPRDPSHACLCTRDGFIHFLQNVCTPRPLQEKRKYQLSKDQTTLQVVYCPSLEDAVWVLLPRQALQFDLQIHQAIGTIALSSGSISSFKEILMPPECSASYPPCMLLHHADHTISLWVRPRSEKWRHRGLSSAAMDEVDSSPWTYRWTTHRAVRLTMTRALGIALIDVRQASNDASVYKIAAVDGDGSVGIYEVCDDCADASHTDGDCLRNPLPAPMVGTLETAAGGRGSTAVQSIAVSDDGTKTVIGGSRRTIYFDDDGEVPVIRVFRTETAELLCALALPWISFADTVHLYSSAHFRHGSGSGETFGSSSAPLKPLRRSRSLNLTTTAATLDATPCIDAGDTSQRSGSTLTTELVGVESICFLDKFAKHLAVVVRVRLHPTNKQIGRSYSSDKNNTTATKLHMDSHANSSDEVVMQVQAVEIVTGYRRLLWEGTVFEGVERSNRSLARACPHFSWHQVALVQFLRISQNFEDLNQGL